MRQARFQSIAARPAEVPNLDPATTRDRAREIAPLRAPAVATLMARHEGDCAALLLGAGEKGGIEFILPNKSN